MNLKLSVALLFFLSIVLVKAQADTTKIKSYADQVMVRVNLDTNIENYIFTEGPEDKPLETILQSIIKSGPHFPLITELSVPPFHSHQASFPGIMMTSLKGPVHILI